MVYFICVQNTVKWPLLWHASIVMAYPTYLYLSTWRKRNPYFMKGVWILPFCTAVGACRHGRCKQTRAMGSDDDDSMQTNDHGWSRNSMCHAVEADHGIAN